MKYLMQISSHLVFRLVVILTILFGLQTITAQAQDAGFEAGLAGQAATRLGMDMTSNVIGMNMIEAATKNRGAARIKAGKATTTFVHSPDIYEYMYDKLTYDETDPPTKAGRLQDMQRQVRNFEARMLKAGGYKIHDAADSANFSSILSYQAYFDKTQLTPAQLKIFQQTSRNTIQYLLNSVDFQGMPEIEKEQMYILDAIMSEQAIEWREKGRAARTSNEREMADQKAKEYAEHKINLHSQKLLGEIEQAGK